MLKKKLKGVNDEIFLFYFLQSGGKTIVYGKMWTNCGQSNVTSILYEIHVSGCQSHRFNLWSVARHISRYSILSARYFLELSVRRLTALSDTTYTIRQTNDSLLNHRENGTAAKFRSAHVDDRAALEMSRLAFARLRTIC